VKIERVGLGELDGVIAVLSEAARWLRSTNEALRRYDERHGFVHRGDRTIVDNGTSLSERRIAEATR
jgi:hypothetical protein